MRLTLPHGEPRRAALVIKVREQAGGFANVEGFFVTLVDGGSQLRNEATTGKAQQSFQQQFSIAEMVMDSGVRHAEVVGDALHFDAVRSLCDQIAFGGFQNRLLRFFDAAADAFARLICHFEFSGGWRSGLLPRLVKVRCRFRRSQRN